MTRLKTVFHVHTDHSDDSNNSAERLVELAGRSGVTCLGITDHDTLSGAQEVAAKAGGDLKVIVGEEISTRDGHVAGLFLRELIEPGMSARRTAEAIRRQGGLVVVPHPFSKVFDNSLRDRLSDILDLIDIVEVCNAQNVTPFANRKAEALARGGGYPSIVGVDFHHADSLDACYQWLEPFDGPDTFLESLKKATFVKGHHPLSYFVTSASIVLRSKLGLPLGQDYGRNCARIGPRTKPVPVSVRSE